MTIKMKLIDSVTGNDINIGDKRECHNEDDLVTITGWETNGRNRVYFTYANGYDSRIEGGNFAGVIGGKLVEAS